MFTTAVPILKLFAWGVLQRPKKGLRTKTISVIPTGANGNIGDTGTRGETEGPPRTLLPTRLDPTLRRFGVPPLSYVFTRNRCAGREQIDYSLD